MAKIQSKALTTSDDFQANRAAHLEALGVVAEAAAKATQGGGERSRERHVSRGKMLPRERVANLLDQFGQLRSLRLQKSRTQGPHDCHADE